MEFRVHLLWLRLQSRELGLLLGIGHKILKKLCGGWVRSPVTRLCFLFLCTSQWCECVEEPDDDTKIIYYLAGSVEIWRFLNVLIIMKLIGGYFFRQQQHFTSWEFLNVNVLMLTHRGTHNQSAPWNWFSNILNTPCVPTISWDLTPLETCDKVTYVPYASPSLGARQQQGRDRSW